MRWPILAERWGAGRGRVLARKSCPHLLYVLGMSLRKLAGRIAVLAGAAGRKVKDRFRAK